ncbi:carboxylate-amine ligase [Streptomyces sp. URMC 123]|uniref:carboxylate-amine ligase n=1 Tax=Streptomyces sp. URMC 123 TaxID=3423403 RepID=UPI003F1B07AB
MLTLGVEEEYLLLDPDTGLPVPRGRQVRAAARLRPDMDGPEVQSELLQAQVEVATPVCRELTEVGEHLRRMRQILGAAAEQEGCRLAACASAPNSPAAAVPVTDERRYRKMREDAARLVDEQLVNGMHVHVAVPDRPTAVAVLNRVRPWLPTLVALSSNSPLWEGYDTGFSSWRTVVFDRWPVSGPPPAFADADDYERRVKALLATGTIRDRGQLYWHARLSENYPTLELRVTDVQLHVDDAVMFAGLIRALVATALGEEDGSPTPATPPELSYAATWQAARHGLGQALIDERGRRRAAGEVVRDFVEHVRPALEEAGDLDRVTSLVNRVLREGTGAAHQRRALAEGGWRGLIDCVTSRTVEPSRMAEPSGSGEPGAEPGGSDKPGAEPSGSGEPSGSSEPTRTGEPAAAG